MEVGVGVGMSKLWRIFSSHEEREIAVPLDSLTIRKRVGNKKAKDPILTDCSVIRFLH